MTRRRFIAGDWGTSRLRLYLCEDGRVVDRRAGPGAVAPHEPHETILFSLAGAWLDAGPAPVLLSGMVGSRNGWVETPYAPCPAGAEALRRLLVRFEAAGASVAIVPGVSGRSANGGPDVMRGEETQILGALALHPELRHGRRLVVLPGTHTKWTVVEDGCIVGLQTALTGEMFALLRDHATLARLGDDAPAGAGDGFERGLARQEETASAGLLHALFEVRSRQLVDGWGGALALDYLSGLLIGADVAGGLVQHGRPAAPVTLVGDPLLTARYARAFARRGVVSRELAGEGCALAGLAAIFHPEEAGNVRAH